MKLASSLLAVFFLAFLGSGVAAQDAAEDAPKLSEIDQAFLNDLADYYDVPMETLEDIMGTKIAIDEIPVALDVFKRDKSNPKTLAEVRAKGDAWSDIFRARTQVRANDFYILISAKVESETYAPIFGLFKESPEDKWKEIKLRDEDVVNMSNLRWISSHHDYSVFEIMAMRDQDKSFPEINHEVGAIKKKMIEEAKKKQREESKSRDN